MVHNALAGLCAKLDVKTLNKLSIVVGSSQGKNKQERFNSILRQLQRFESLQCTRDNKQSLRITSIDTGVTNFSWSTVLVRPTSQSQPITVEHWEKVQLENAFLNGEALTFAPEQTTRLVTNLNKHIPKQAVDLFTIEKQRLRTSSSRFITDPIIKVNILEHLLYYSLVKSHNGNGSTNDAMPSIFSSDPIRMTNYWMLRDPGTKINSKKLRIETVVAMMLHQVKPNDLPVQFSTDLARKISEYVSRRGKRKKFHVYDCLQLTEQDAGPRKDDDLADSLLHAMSWALWWQTSQQVTEHLGPRKNATAASLAALVDDCWLQRVALLDGHVTGDGGASCQQKVARSSKR